MQMRLSGLRGLRGLRDEDGRPLAERLEALAAGALRRFSDRLRDVALHVESDHGDPSAPAACRVAVRRRHGPLLTAAARGHDPESAVRRALERMRRVLARDAERRLTFRTRRAAA